MSMQDAGTGPAGGAPAPRSTRSAEPTGDALAPISDSGGSCGHATLSGRQDERPAGTTPARVRGADQVRARPSRRAFAEPVAPGPIGRRRATLVPLHLVHR